MNTIHETMRLWRAYK